MSGSDVMDGAPVEDIPTLFALVETPQGAMQDFLDAGSLRRPKRSRQWKSHLRQILAFGGDTTGVSL
jgi:hypothetical protein